MIIFGLTGSIGMGKSTAAAMLKRMRIPVHEADKAVHEALAAGGAGVTAVASLYPKALQKDEKGRAFINRAVLGKAAFSDEKLLRKLEDILHPLVQSSEKKFIQRARAQRHGAVVLDIPLLFETGAENRVHVIITVSAPAFVQRARVLSRPHMTADKLKAILARQVPDFEKRKRSDAVVPTGLGRGVTLLALKQILRHTGEGE